MTATDMAALIDTHAAALRLYARAWCATPDDAVQDALCKLVTATPPDDPVAWLYRTVRNVAIDRGRAESRRKRREVRHAKAELWFDDSASSELDSATAVRALEKLPDDLREVIIARLWGNLTFEQIAVALECSTSSAYRRYEAGVAQLRIALGEPCPT